MAQETKVTKVARSGRSSQELVPARTRIGVAIVNDSSLPLYIRFGDEPATLDDWSVILDPKARMGPFGLSYDGAVQGMWDGQGPALARVTELLP